MENNQFVIRDEEGKVYNEVHTPTAVFDSETGVLYKIGERDVMEEYFEFVQSQYRNAGYHNMANAVVLMELPKEQDIVDKVFQNTGYIGRLYQQAVSPE